MDKLWDDLKKAIEDEKANIEKQRAAFRKEREEYEETKKKVSSVHFSSTIKLDIGGRQFKTTLNTLRKEDSMLSRMFSGSGFLVEKDEDGFYFIDRPGEYFAPILHYLQTGVFMPPKDEVSLAMLKMEVDFYQIPSLIEYFKPKSNNIPSKVLTKPMLEKLVSVFPETWKCSWKLILEVDGNGSAGPFDAAVKGKNRILIVIQSTNNYIFGAYVADTFGQPGGWVSGSRDTFLWTLQNNNTPVKLNYTGSGHSGHFQSCGLHLGNSTNELGAFCSHSCAAPQSYGLAPGFSAVLTDKLLAGANSWTAKRMEVFEMINE